MDTSSDRLWIEKKKAIESEYAKMIGLTQEDLETLSELVPFVSRSELSVHPVSRVDDAEKCYQLRFEAAEVRYGRMKALLNASLEAQMRLKSQTKGRFIVESLGELGLGSSAAVEVILGQKSLDESSRRQMVEQIWELVCELKHAKQNSSTEMGGNSETKKMEEDAFDAESELASARKRIAALDLELNRMNEKSFDDDERVRECEDVFDTILGRVHADTDGVHPKFHPMTTCSDPACQNYARRLRNGVKQAVAEAYVRERSVRIHGYFRYQVEPLERLRLEKDREIESLRFQLKRLEHVSCMSSDDVTMEQLDMDKVIRRVEIDTLAMNSRKLKDENVVLSSERDRWTGIIVGMQEEVRNAEATIEESKSAQARMGMETEMFNSQKAGLEKMLKQIEDFKNGGMASVYYDRVRALEKLQSDITLMEERIAKQQHQSHEDVAEEVKSDAEVNEGTEKRARKPSFLIKNGQSLVRKDEQGNILIMCKCNKEIPLCGIPDHVVREHTPNASKPTILCPSGCGYFVLWNRTGDMAKHVKGLACSERIQEIQRLS